MPALTFANFTQNLLYRDAFYKLIIHRGDSCVARTHLSHNIFYILQLYVITQTIVFIRIIFSKPYALSPTTLQKIRQKLTLLKPYHNDHGHSSICTNFKLHPKSILIELTQLVKVVTNIFRIFDMKRKFLFLKNSSKLFKPSSHPYIKFAS